MKSISLRGILTVVYFLITLTHVHAVKTLNTLEEIDEEISGLAKTIKEARGAFGIKAVAALKKASQDFDTLSCNDNFWAKFTQQKKDTYNIVVWPQSTYKQALGASLFYPKEEVERYLDSTFTDHLLERNDMLWSFAIATKYKDPRAKYYLASTLKEIWNKYHDDEEEDLPAYYDILAKQARDELEAARQNTQGLYLLGLDYNTSVETAKAEECFSQIIVSEHATAYEKAMSKLTLLRMKSEYRGYYAKENPPSFEDYEKLAKRPEFPFGKAIDHGLRARPRKDPNDMEESVPYLIEAAKTYPASYIKLGVAKQRKKAFGEARGYYTQASKAGISYGDIKLGILAIGIDILDKDSEKVVAHFVNLNDQAFVEAETAFREAIKKGDFKGWEYVTSLYASLGALKKDKKYNDAYDEALKGALSFGSHLAYAWLEDLKDVYTLPTIEKLLQEYGKAPQKDLWKDIKAFIEHK